MATDHQKMPTWIWSSQQTQVQSEVSGNPGRLHGNSTPVSTKGGGGFWKLPAPLPEAGGTLEGTTPPGVMRARVPPNGVSESSLRNEVLPTITIAAVAEI